MVWRKAPPGHPARGAAAWAGVAITAEAFIGAAIVFYEWVADDESTARAIAVPLHLLNTFTLLAALTLTAWFLQGGGRLVVAGARRGWIIAGAVALLAIAGSGAVTALADTLFPSESLRSGLAAAIDSTEHFLTRLRVLHPVLAVLAVASGTIALRLSPVPVLSRVMGLLILSIVQLVLGLLTIALGGPLWIRLVHLAMADVIWISYVWLAGQTLSSMPDNASTESVGARQAKPVHR
jgi:heme A synthase